MWFMVDGNLVRFGMKDFSLIAGLNCGPFPKPKMEERVKKGKVAKNFLRKVIGEQQLLSVHDLDNGSPSCYGLYLDILCISVI